MVASSADGPIHPTCWEALTLCVLYPILYYVNTSPLAGELSGYGIRETDLSIAFVPQRSESTIARQSKCQSFLGEWARWTSTQLGMKALCITSYPRQDINNSLRNNVSFADIYFFL